MKKNNDLTALGCVGAMALLPIVIALSAVINGLALSVLWGWFMVTTFGFPSLSIPQAIGLGLVVSFLTHQDVAKDDSGGGIEKVLISAISVVIVKAIIYLSVGWVVFQFFGGV